MFNTKQGSLSVSQYHKNLNELWIKLDKNQNLKKCKTNMIFVNCQSIIVHSNKE